VENRPKALLGLVVGLAIALLTGIAQAQQLTVAVTNSGTQTTSPGSSVSPGEFSIANSYSTNVTVTQVQLSISNPSLFSSMTMTATGSDTSSQTINVPLQTSSTITFASPVPLNVNQPAATFYLSAKIAGGTATATPTTAANAGGVDFAIGMLWMDGRLRRRHLVMLMLALVLAAAEVGCGNCGNSLFGCGGGSNTGTGSSDQQITGIATNPDTTLSYTSPAPDLGTITSQN